MKLFLKIFVLLFSLSSFTQVEPKTELVDTLADLLREGNSKELAQFLDNTIELTLQDRESSYSKAQTEIILKNFFLKNPPKSFKVMHRGSSEKGGKYLIGLLTVENGSSFRTSIVMQEKADGYKIQQLRFE
jgi:hypothetical protein